MEEQYGPAMRVLAPKQRAFVECLLEAGDDNHARAYIAAGYQAAAPHKEAYKLVRLPSVQAAIREEGLKRINAGTIVAVSRLVEIAAGRDTNAKTGDQLKAIAMILNRAGLSETTEHKVTVEHVHNNQELIGRIRVLANEMGLDSRRLLGNAGVIDAEFTEVQQEKKWDDP